MRKSFRTFQIWRFNFVGSLESNTTVHKENRKEIEWMAYDIQAHVSFENLFHVGTHHISFSSTKAWDPTGTELRM